MARRDACIEREEVFMIPTKRALDMSLLKVEKYTGNLDVEFCEIFHKAVITLLDINADGTNVNYNRYYNMFRKFAGSSCEFYGSPNSDDWNTIALLMDSLYYRVTYIYKNSTLLCSAVAFHFQNILRENPGIRKTLLSKKVLRICSLGGGPGSDAVALVKVLESMAEAEKVNLDIRVTVIDVDSNWSNTYIGVLRCLERFRNATLKLKFIQADLGKFHSCETLKVIGEADIVTVAKFFSEFVGRQQILPEIIEMLRETMLPGSLLFFLDRPKMNLIKLCGGPSGYLEDLDLIYEELCDLHTLQISAMKRQFKLFTKHFGDNVCNTCLKVFVRAWLKSGPQEMPHRDLLTKSRFIEKTEKCNASYYVSSDFFTEWDKSFFKEVTKSLWTSQAAEEYFSQQIEMRDDLFLKLKDTIELLKVEHAELLEGIATVAAIDDICWTKFYTRKLDIAFYKRSIYCEIIINLRGYLKTLYNVKTFVLQK